MFTPFGTAKPWLQTFTPRPDARLRLLCFHPAGAGPNFYRSWDSLLPRDVEVSAVHLPGREGRFAEPRLTDYPRRSRACTRRCGRCSTAPTRSSGTAWVRSSPTASR